MLRAVLCYAQPLKVGICTAFLYIFFGNYPFLSRLNEVYLSLNDLEIWDEFNLLQNLYKQKSVCATSTRPFGEVSGNSPLQLSSQTHFAKIEDKKVIAKNKF